jgi:hypothetical protein
MGTDDPSSVGLAEKKQKMGKPACRDLSPLAEFLFLSCPIRAANAPVFIWVI